MMTSRNNAVTKNVLPHLALPSSRRYLAPAQRASMTRRCLMLTVMSHRGRPVPVFSAGMTSITSLWCRLFSFPYFPCYLLWCVLRQNMWILVLDLEFRRHLFVDHLRRLSNRDDSQ